MSYNFHLNMQFGVCHYALFPGDRAQLNMRWKVGLDLNTHAFSAQTLCSSTSMDGWDVIKTGGQIF
jgi:hypothetical protein